MKFLPPLLLTCLLCSGCATVSDTAVRIWFEDVGLSHRVGSQIREGLEKREALPVRTQPSRPAPAFLDQG